MTDRKYIQAYFSYEDGDRKALYEAHRRAFAQHDRFEVEPPFVRSSLGTVEVISDDVPEMTNTSFVEYYEYEGDVGELDLLWSPLIWYLAGEPDILENAGSDEGITEEQIDDLVEMVKVGYSCTDERPIEVHAETPDQFFRLRDKGQPAFSAKSLLEHRYLCLSWLTVFTPPMVETYGRETLLSAPAYRIEELDDGAILVVCHDSPLDHEASCGDVAEHLGMVACEDV